MPAEAPYLAPAAGETLRPLRRLRNEGDTWIASLPHPAVAHAVSDAAPCVRPPEVSSLLAHPAGGSGKTPRLHPRHQADPGGAMYPLPRPDALQGGAPPR